MLGAGFQRQRPIAHPLAIDPHRPLVDLAVRFRGGSGKPGLLEEVREAKSRPLDRGSRCSGRSSGTAFWLTRAVKLRCARSAAAAS